MPSQATQDTLPQNTARIPQLRALVFDFDGTLAKLTLDFNVMRQRLGELAQEYAPAPPDPFGHAILEWQQLVAGQLGNGSQAESDSAQDFLARSADLILSMEVEAARQGMLFAFTRPLFQALRRAGIQSAIITRNCSQAVQYVFPDYAEYCPTLLTRDDVQRAKPDPKHLLTALQQIGCTPQESLMIGDHPMDILTGKRAGAWTAGVASGRVSQQELLASGADLSAADCDELVQILRAMGSLELTP